MNVTSDQNGLMVSLSRYKPWGGSRGGAGTTLTDYAFTGQRKISYIKLDWYGSRKKNSCRPFQFKRGFETPAETILERRPGTLEAWKQLFNSNPSRRVSKMNDALCSEVSIETLAPMRVACYRAASLSPEEDGAKFMLDRWNQQSGAAPGRRFGFDMDVTPEQQKKACAAIRSGWLCRQGFSRRRGDAAGVRRRAVCGADAGSPVRGPVCAHSGGVESAARVGDREQRVPQRGAPVAGGDRAGDRRRRQGRSETVSSDPDGIKRRGFNRR